MPSRPPRWEWCHGLRVSPATSLTHSLALLPRFAAGLAVVADAPQLAGSIAAIVVINGVLSFVQDGAGYRS